MISRRIDFTQVTPIETVYEKLPPAINTEDFKVGKCPECGSFMFGHFDALDKFGVEWWCSACGFMYPPLTKECGLSAKVQYEDGSDEPIEGESVEFD